MALFRRLKEEEDNPDITVGLESLQFESALSEQELKCLSLRKATHALTVTACAQAVHAVSVLNEARQIKEELKNPTARRTSRLLQHAATKDPLLVGIIGCGRLGSHLARCLLSFAQVNPEELKISTRRPETLTEFRDKGTMCVNNNCQVASTVHLLFLCVLPSQFQSVADEIKDSICNNTIVYSLMSSVSSHRIKQLLGVSNILRPDYYWDENTCEKRWNFTLELKSVFAEPGMVELTCPLIFDEDRCVVKTNDNFAIQLILVLTNMCSELNLKAKETLNIINAVVFEETTDNPLTDPLDAFDLYPELKSKSDKIQKLDTVDALDTNFVLPLKNRLVAENNLRERFVTKYCNVFAQYLQWMRYATEET